MTVLTRESDQETLLQLRDGKYVQVAIPVPLRQTFTYELPPELEHKNLLGFRVAVPFGTRKLAGYVVGRPSQLPPLSKIKEVAGLLDREPLFSEELLAFLRQAADYYLHPLGNVLRAAAPALPREALRTLREQGFLEEGETIPGTSVAIHRELFIKIGSAYQTAESPRLGKKQHLVIQLLLEREEVSLNELRRHIKNPRSVVRTLEQKGWISTTEREVPKDRFFSVSVERESPPELNRFQAAASDAIITALGLGNRAFLLHGVTSSGKTEVYLRVISEARARGLGALILVPEIALTPQLVSRFRARFGDAIAVLHSGLTNRERFDAWRNLHQGRVDLAIGARSALFAPVQRLGVIIIDEEHDSSFKQEEGFRYHARDMALLRAHRAGAVCVLGSATPSLESFSRAEQGKLTLLNLPERVTPQPLPDVEIIDLARHRKGPSSHRLLTGPLHQALDQCLQNGGQAILFLNRRGFAPCLRCHSCNEVMQCPACNVSLTEHLRQGLLRCHYCDFTTPIKGRCLYCGSEEIEQLGIGTERLEEALKETFPSARVARLDRDTAVGEGVERVLDRLRNRQIDILVGTQMVTKGHDIPGVVLVGVVLADQSLAFPDFRASERTFQLLTQVAGRAGRGRQLGRVLVQSYQPDHLAVRFAQKHDYLGFYSEELKARRELGYSPFSRMVCVRIDAGGEVQARTATRNLVQEAQTHRAVLRGIVRVLGPAPALISRVRGRFRFQFMLLSADRAALRSVAQKVCARIDQGIAPAHAILDVDPISMF